VGFIFTFLSADGWDEESASAGLDSENPHIAQFGDIVFEFDGEDTIQVTMYDGDDDFYVTGGDYSGTYVRLGVLSEKLYQAEAMDLLFSAVSDEMGDCQVYYAGMGELDGQRVYLFDVGSNGTAEFVPERSFAVTEYGEMHEFIDDAYVPCN
jgi:hypothetical protein